MSSERILSSLLDQPAGEVYCMGIGGFGMAGLAWLLKGRGFEVSGSDLVKNRLTSWLQQRGIQVFSEHDVGHLHKNTVLVVRSTAVAEYHPVIRRAVEQGIPVVQRGACLAALTLDGYAIAVAGTHGKTTTTAMIAQILKDAGREPGFCIGGEVPKLGGLADRGAGKMMVVEADESDGTLAQYAPYVGVITNIEFDHMEYFSGEASFLACFQSFIDRVRDRLFYCGDDPHAKRLCGRLSNAASYGFDPENNLSAKVIEESGDAVVFEVFQDRASQGIFELPLPGRHNVLNALAAMMVCREQGLADEEIRPGLKAFESVRRRFEHFVGENGVTVISDYAHHPTEIRALLSMVRLKKTGRIIAVFQPHRYTRTRQLLEAFPPAFDGVDALLLTPVYAASEQPLPGGTSEDLLQAFKSYTAAEVRLMDSPRAAWEGVRKDLRSGDLFLIVGAGDVEVIWSLAQEQWQTEEDHESR